MREEDKQNKTYLSNIAFLTFFEYEKYIIDDENLKSSLKSIFDPQNLN